MDIPQKDADNLLKLLKIPTNVGSGIAFDNKKKVVTLKSVDEKEEFLLDVTPSHVKIEKITYQTRARKSTILARLDLDGPPHRNPDGKKIGCPHIHIYKEGYGTRWAYPLPDEFSNCNNQWEYLVQFLNYCNVSNNPFNQPVISI